MDIEKVLSELTLEEKASLCSGGDFWHTKAVERLGIPSVMMCDGPHGLRKQNAAGDHLGINESIETVCYPSASALAASFDRDVPDRLGHALGQECQAEDVAMLLGPGLNMKRSPLCGRNFEYFSEDPYLAGELGSAYIEAMNAEGIATCVKHFAANDQETCRMSGSSNMDERTLHEIYLPAYEAAVKKGKTRSVMCAYNGINGTFCSENRELLSDILRRDWGYEGFVVTDWGAVKDRVKGLEAGLDLEMPGGPGVQDAGIVEAVKNGTLQEEVLDAAVRNMLKFAEDALRQHKDGAQIDRDACRRLSGELAAQCAVLLKNDNAVLPLRKDAKIAFIGEFADKVRYQGAGSSHINVPHSVSALEAMNNGSVSDFTGAVAYARGYDVHSDDTDEIMMEEALSAAEAADAAVIFAGLPDSYETEGVDRDTMAIPANQNALIEAVSKVQPNTIVVLHGGSAMELPWIDEVKGILCMYLGGERVGEACVKLLFGDENPNGKLAETWPIKLEDNPSYLNFPGVDGQVEYREGVYIGYRYYDKKKMAVAFPFGYGLSYTEFAYSDLKLSSEAIRDTDTLIVTCKIKNIGQMAGREAVQLYVGSGDGNRPVRELKGFEKVSLAPGEEKEVSFALDKRSFAYYEARVHDWFVKSASYTIEIGASSRDIRLCAAVQVESEDEIPIHYTLLSTVGDLLKTKRGSALFAQMMQAAGGQDMDAEKENMENLGEGSDKMMQAMMMEMPLQSIATFGVMSLEQLNGIVAMLNA